jgi:hypothetical protein
VQVAFLVKKAKELKEISLVQQAFIIEYPNSDFPQLSIRKAAFAVVVSPTQVHYICNDDLHLKAFKFYLWHKLEDQNNGKRLNLPHPFL